MVTATATTPATMSNPQLSAARPAGQEHIPQYPTNWIAIRIVQLVLSVVILALTAYNIHYLSYDGNSLMLAVAVMCIVSSVYHVVSHFGFPQVYNYWAVLGLDILFVVLWLVAFALQAARIALVYDAVGESSSYSYNYYTGRYTSTKNSLSDTESAWLGTQAGTAALGGVQFVLFIVALVIHSIRLHRHRAAGYHCMPGASRTLPGAGPTGAAVVSPATVVVPNTGAVRQPGFPPAAYQQHPPQAASPVYQQHQPPHPGQQMQMFPQPYPQQQQHQPQHGQQAFYPPAQQQPNPQHPQQNPPIQQNQQGFYQPTPTSPTQQGQQQPPMLGPIPPISPVPQAHMLYAAPPPPPAQSPSPSSEVGLQGQQQQQRQ